MYQSSTYIDSQHAAKYLTTLCRHFARKVPAEWNETKGMVTFPKGDCEMHINETQDQLLILCKADTPDNLTALKNIIAGHVQLFSRRETITLDWQT